MLYLLRLSRSKNTTCFHVLAVVLIFLMSSCCTVPREGFMDTPEVQAKMQKLEQDLINLLPEGDQSRQAAQNEAKWITHTAFEQSAIQARKNKQIFIGWVNNNFVNTKILPRGLCWHYQHDLYRELRRKPLKYFFLGATVRDEGKGAEHNCVYVNAKNLRYDGSIVLDGWRYCGNLDILMPEDRKENWKDSPGITQMLEAYFPEGHTFSNDAYIYFVKKENGKNYPEMSPAGNSGN